MKNHKHQHLKVKLVNPKNSEYKGMNPRAARELGIKHPKKCLTVDRGLSSRETGITIGHERYENYIMENGVRYHRGHNLATRYIDYRERY
jgi:hypothetical protein